MLTFYFHYSRFFDFRINIDGGIIISRSNDERAKTARCNFDEYYLVDLASIINPDNTLTSVKRNIVEKMLQHVDKEGVTHNGENVTSVLLR